MVDANLHVSLIEVNSNPCLEDWCSPLLARLIPCMLEDIFRTAVDPVFASPPARTSATEPPPPPPSPSPPTGPSVPIAPRHYGPSSPASPSSPTAPEVSGDSVAQWCTQAAEMAADTSRRNGFEQLVEVVVVTNSKQDASGNGNRGEAGRGTGTEANGEDGALPGDEGAAGGEDGEDGGVGGEEEVEGRGRESDSAPEDSPVEKGRAGVDDASPEISGLSTAAVGGGGSALPGEGAVPGGGVGTAEGERDDEATEEVQVAAVEGST